MKVESLEKVAESKVNVKRTGNVFGRVKRESERQKRKHQEKHILRSEVVSGQCILKDKKRFTEAGILELKRMMV